MRAFFFRNSDSARTDGGTTGDVGGRVAQNHDLVSGGDPPQERLGADRGDRFGRGSHRRRGVRTRLGVDGRRGEEGKEDGRAVHMNFPGQMPRALAGMGAALG